MSEVSVIDFAVHPPTPEFPEYTLFAPKGSAVQERVGARLPDSHRAYGQPESLAMWDAEMEAAGVVKAVVYGRCLPFEGAVLPNDYIADLQTRFPSRVVGFATVDPIGTIHDPVEETERCVKDLGLHGVYIEPGRCLQPHRGHMAGIHIDDPILIPLYETCRDLGIPIVLCTGPYGGYDLSFSDPSRIDHIAGIFPSLTIVVAHGCWPFAAELVAIAYKRANVFVGPDFYLFMPGTSPYVEAMRHPVLSRQILFGTQYPVRRFDDTVAEYLKFDLPDDQQSAVLSGNASRILGLG